MVKFVVVRVKTKLGLHVQNGQLAEPEEIIAWERQEATINDLLLKGFEITYHVTLEDLRGMYILFVLYRRPPKT